MQIQEENETPGTDPKITLVYSEDYVEVLKEEEAYSFLSLVADCGGILGLFIGFNFLMVWDWIIIVFSMIPLKSYTAAAKEYWNSNSYSYLC